ncbi:inosine triphosphate pyrophosphatase [Kipferlia bialata]|uniref:Inosine triphosphate pyrophosphatase n=1 Tax=Kipferlia bialata TaxID=797122 RepID=A0A9K3D3I4_9EUKA|nr:inosine triphosphate pyrophosphatase [Kipferlia bialata]|eukprot:g10198.t1
MTKPICFVTGNPNKAREFKHIVGDEFSSSIVHQKFDVPEIQGTPSEVAIAKASAAAAAYGGPVFTEDVSLCFHSLKGLPGPYIKDFFTKLGHDGLNNMLAGFEDKGVTAMCVFAYCPGPSEPVTLFIGECEGYVVPARGNGNFGAFGWDPIFEPVSEREGEGRTFAQMSAEDKHAISHRGNAVRKVVPFIRSLLQ